jgi:hypothetical protein
LEGANYISADSCCDSTRHTRAALPINGSVWISQRMAVDWEQLDNEGRVYSGRREKLESYTIFGKPVLAVSDGVVVNTIDGEPEQTPGKYPQASRSPKLTETSSFKISANTAMPCTRTCSRAAFASTKATASPVAR